MTQVCEFGGDDCIKSPSVLDRTAHKYAKRLIDHIGIVYDYLKDKCNLPDIPPPPTKPQPPRKKVLKIRNTTSNKNGTSVQEKGPVVVKSSAT